MKSNNHVLLEWQMKHDHYEVDWVVVRKKLGNPITDWLLSLEPTDGCVYIYHKPENKKAQLVVEFYNDATESLFVGMLIRK